MRQEFGKKVKLAAWERCNGHCELCTAKLFTGKFTYDHIIPDAMGGEPTLENCQVICRACDTPKTAKDQGDIAKAKRVQAKHVGIRKPRTITRWRRFNGDIVVAEKER